MVQSALLLLASVVGLASASYVPPTMRAQKLQQPAAYRRRVAHAPFAMATPFRSDANFDYFKVVSEKTVTLTKPLGAMLEEAAPAGVKVQDLAEGGSAAETGLLKKGDVLLSVMGADVSSASFDEVMDLLVNAPEEVELAVKRTLMTRKPRVKQPDPVLTVDGEPFKVEHGVVMRTAIQTEGKEIHKGMKAKMSSCGGAGQCASCWVEVVDGMDNLSPPNANEQGRRGKRPESWRMACQALVNGEVEVVVKSLDKP